MHNLLLINGQPVAGTGSELPVFNPSTAPN